MHFMPNNNLEENISHFILIAPKKNIFFCLQKLHFKFLELKNCIWGTRIQDPESFAALQPRHKTKGSLLGICNFLVPWRLTQGTKHDHM